MQTLELDLTKRYTYADYLTWLDNQRRELYNAPKYFGKIIKTFQ